MEKKKKKGGKPVTTLAIIRMGKERGGLWEEAKKKTGKGGREFVF